MKIVRESLTIGIRGKKNGPRKCESPYLGSRRVGTSRKKFNPRKRFRLMLICLSIFLISFAIMCVSVFATEAIFQAIASMFITIISGTVFVVNFGKDIIVSVLNSLTKNSLK